MPLTSHSHKLANPSLNRLRPEILIFDKAREAMRLELTAVCDAAAWAKDQGKKLIFDAMNYLQCPFAKRLLHPLCKRAHLKLIFFVNPRTIFPHPDDVLQYPRNYNFDFAAPSLINPAPFQI